MENKVNQLLGVSMEKIKEMVDVNTVVGEPITTPDGTTLIPISRITCGFAGGGSDLPAKTQGEFFGGGSGAGITITPIAVISVNKGVTQVLPLMTQPSTADTLVNMIPGVVTQVRDFIVDQTGKKNAEDITK